MFLILQMSGVHPGMNTGIMGTHAQPQHPFMNGNGGMNTTTMGPMAGNNASPNMQLAAMGPSSNGNGQINMMPGYHSGVGSARHHQVNKHCFETCNRPLFCYLYFSINSDGIKPNKRQTLQKGMFLFSYLL